MPLQAEDKRMERALDTFDQSVWRRRVNNQAFAQTFHGLVMRCVDLHGSPFEDLMQPRTGFDVDVMAARGLFRAHLVFYGIGELGGNVLGKRSSHSEMGG